MEAPIKRKVTSKLSYNDHSANIVPSPYRPPSPMKSTVSLPIAPTAMIRPKAKINSSATPISRAQVTRPLSAITPTGTRPPASSIPRPASPTKSHTNRSPAPHSHKPRIARPNVRPQSSHSTPGTPTSSYLSIESPESEIKTKHGGSLSVRQTSPPLGLGLSNGALGSNSIFSPPSHEHADLPLKIKSKLSRVALSGPESFSPSPSSSHSGYARVRAPSVSSNHSLGSNTTNSSTKPEYTLYPITPAAAAANPHRYIPNRSAESSPSSHTYQSFSSTSLQDDTTIQYSRIVPKVDPAKIPLPTHSPPTSALSFSSRSSVSRSSVSRSESTNSNTSVSTNHVKSPSGGFDLRVIDSLVQISESTLSPRDELLSPTDDDEIESEDRKARNEAKVNRKIADLEITNRSLLAINSTLEATKHRQAKEIRELRRKLRESRLILPPRTYLAVTSKDTDVSARLEDDEDEDDEDDEEGIVGEDQTYLRIRTRLDEMIQSAQKALTAKPTDFAEMKGPTKVLSEQEVRAWRGSEEVGDDSLVLEGDEDERNEKLATQQSRVPSRIGQRGHADNDPDDIASEDEVEAMTMLRDTPSPPPIVVTSST